MSYESSAKSVPKPHNVIMQQRRTLSLTGIDQVDSFDEDEIVLHTVEGALIIRGSDLKIEKLSLETGEVNVTGLVTQLSYEEVAASGSLWTKLFR